jgi:ribonuclease HI
MKTMYCVGYTHGNPGKGGWGVVIVEEGEIVQQLCGGYRLSTDPRMHVMAFVRGLAQLAEGTQAQCVTCSEYVYYAIVNNRLSTWGSRWDWLAFGGRPRPNWDLWQEVQDLLSEREVSMILARKATGDANLWQADRLARRAAASAQAVDEVYESSDGYRDYLRYREKLASFGRRLDSRLETQSQENLES